MDKEFQKQQKEFDKLNRANEKLERHLKREQNKKDSQNERLELMSESERKIYDSNTPPKRSILEEIGNSVTHGVGAIFGIVALILLVIKSDTGMKLAASIVYGVSIFLAMLVSCLYHAFSQDSGVKRLFRRFDYSGIYLLIGGTFAPLLLVFFRTPEYQSQFPFTFGIENFYSHVGLILFIIQWVLITTGITLISIFGPGRVKVVNFVLYFAIGWSGLMFIPAFVTCKIELLWMILFGGIAYTLGMIPFVLKKVPAAHFIWHFFVLAGAIIQYLGILFYVY